MNRLSMRCEVEEGKLHLENEVEFRRLLKFLTGKFRLTIAREKDKRSEAFNRYYMGFCGKIVKELEKRNCGGWTNDDVHEYNKLECNPVLRLFVDEHGEIHDKRFGGSTKEMSPEEFAVFIEAVKKKWGENGYFVKDKYWEE